MQTNGSSPRRARVGLLALNAALLLALGAVTFMPAAQAQSRPRGTYTMVGARVNGALGGVVYIVDVRNEELVAVTWDPNQRGLSGIGYRNIAADAINLGRAGGNK